MKVSNLTKFSVVLRSDLKPDWNNDICLLDSKNQVSLLLIIISTGVQLKGKATCQSYRSIITHIMFRRILTRFWNRNK